MKRCATLLTVSGLALSASPAYANDPADHARAYAAELQADAEARTSLLQGQTSAGPKGFKISDAAGDYTLKISGQSQTRFNINMRDMAPSGDEDTTIGFHQRRTKVAFSGNVVNPDWGYKINGAFGRDGGAFVLEDAYGTYAMNENTSLKWGQFKSPLLREESVSSSRQLTADRSPTNEEFNQGRTQGIMVTYATDDFRLMGSFNDGLKTPNTPFNSTSEADFGFSGRGEWKFAGESWSPFKDFTSFQNSEFSGMAGTAIHYQDGGSTGGPTADMSMMVCTTDISLEGNGWNAFGAFIWRSTDNGVDADDFGIIAQGGVFLTDSDELFGRYDIIMPDDSVGDDFSTVTFGWNHYFVPESHAVKFTADVQVFIDEQSSAGTVSVNEGIGLLADTEGGQVALRFQMQLLF